MKIRILGADFLISACNIRIFYHKSAEPPHFQINATPLTINRGLLKLTEPNSFHVWCYHSRQ